MLKSNEVQRIVRIKHYYKNECETKTIDVFERDLKEGQKLDSVVNCMLKNIITNGFHIYRITVKRADKKLKKGWFKK